MEKSAPDFAWGDAQAAAVAVKHAGARLYASLQWRHGYQDDHAPRVPSNVHLNDIARVHFTVAGRDYILNAHMQNMTGEAAGWSRLYAVGPIGNFTIAMNLSPQPLAWTLPASLVGAGAVDLVSGAKHCPLSPSMLVSDTTTVVLRTVKCER